MIGSLEARTRQEIRTDHLQTIATRLVRTQHQRRRFHRLLDYWNLGLVEFEVDNFPGFRVLTGKFLLHLPLELILGQGMRFVQGNESGGKIRMGPRAGKEGLHCQTSPLGRTTLGSNSVLLELERRRTLRSEHFRILGICVFIRIQRSRTIARFATQNF